MTRPLYAATALAIGLSLGSLGELPAEPLPVPVPTATLLTITEEPEVAMVGDDAPSAAELAPEVKTGAAHGVLIWPEPRARSVGVSHTLTGEISAYCISGVTRSGTHTRPGVVATDRAFIPQWTRLRIDGLPGEYVSEDTGSAVVGHRIDVYMPSCAAALQFGRQHRTVSVLS